MLQSGMRVSPGKMQGMERLWDRPWKVGKLSGNGLCVAACEASYGSETVREL